MESIPSTNPAATMSASAGVKTSPNSVANNLSKYGTMSGRSCVAVINNNRPQHHSYLHPSSQLNELYNQMETNAQQQHVSATSQRLRSINRSFRTAVDKSFDMPSSSDLSMDLRAFGPNAKPSPPMPSHSQRSACDQVDKKLIQKKSLIETFQKLFKSSHKKNAANTSKSNTQLDGSNISKPIELLNYKKRDLAQQNQSKLVNIKTSQTNNTRF